ncbi:hypothetical protein [Engelhardtia mirabilis]
MTATLAAANSSRREAGASRGDLHLALDFGEFERLATGLELKLEPQFDGPGGTVQEIVVGSHTFEDLPLGRYRIAALVDSWHVDPDEIEHVGGRSVTLAVRPTLVIRGRVLPDPTVAQEFPGTVDVAGVFELDTTSSEPGYFVQTRTVPLEPGSSESAGRFWMSPGMLTPSAELALILPGHAAYELGQIFMPKEGTLDLGDLPFMAEEVLRVRLVDGATGASLEGGSVRALSFEQGSPFPRDRDELRRRVLLEHMAEHDPAPSAVDRDAAGLLHLPLPFGRPALIEARHPDYARETVWVGADHSPSLELEVSMASAARLEGVVLVGESGTEVVSVELTELRTGGRRLQAEMNRAGPLIEFSLAGIRPGDHELTVLGLEVPDLELDPELVAPKALAVERLSLAPGERARRTIDLDGGVLGSTIVGTFSHPYPGAVGGCRALLFEEDPLRPTRLATVDVGGAFRLTGAGAGSHDLVCGATSEDSSQLLLAHRAIDVDGAGVLEVHLAVNDVVLNGTIDPSSGASPALRFVRGEVLGGEPQAPACLAPVLRMKTDVDGRFTITGLPPGHYRFATREGDWSASYLVTADGVTKVP